MSGSAAKEVVMSSGKEGFVSGLEGVAVAETVLSHVDGSAGRLVVAGEDIEDLAGHRSFEEVAAALWALDEEPLPAREVRDALGEARREAFALVPSIGCALGASDAMDALRAAVAHLAERPLS